MARNKDLLYAGVFFLAIGFAIGFFLFLTSENPALPVIEETVNLTEDATLQEDLALKQAGQLNEFLWLLVGFLFLLAAGLIAEHYKA
jgi:hypothetical protein